jgi:hypothetical protein
LINSLSLSISIFSEATPTKPTNKQILPIKKPATVPQSAPKYQNDKLRQIIVQQKGKSTLDLRRKNLTNQDMEIVAFYALQNNMVSNNDLV